ncbi:hypothetical protein [Archangium sp.]|uniref:hypothetical protein n=1 Tax=Archangium sp. TaxID=1872627 RepID=UPI00389AEA66
MEWLLSSPLLLELVRGVLLLVALVALLYACAVVGEHFVRRRWFRSYRLASEQLRRGYSSRAEALFRESARWSYGSLRTAALAGVGVCRLHQGAYAEAVALLEPLMKRRLPPWMALDELALRGHLALGLAMLGETRRAWRWIHEACRRFDGMPTFLVMPTVAILCREGNVGAALKKMEESWAMVLAEGFVCGRLRLFRAYAQSKVDPERDVGFVILTLHSLAPFPEKELAFFREHWPVFADFLERGNEMVAAREAERARWLAAEQAAREEAAARARPPAPGEDDSSG